MYNAALRPSAPRYSLRLSSTQRFVMYNATNAATWLWAPQRLATRLSVLRRVSIQLNDLFISFRVSTRRYSARLGTSQRRAPQCYSTICLLLRAAPKRSAPQLYTPFSSAPLRSSTQRFVCQFNRTATQRSALHRFAARLYASRRKDLFVIFRSFALRLSTRLVSARCDAPLRNATICLLQRLSTRLGFSQGTTAPRRSPRLNSTQRFVCQFIITTRRSALLRHAPRRVSTRLNSTQRTET